MLRSLLGSVLRTVAASTSSQHVRSSYVVTGRCFASLNSLVRENPYKTGYISTMSVEKPRSLLQSAGLTSSISITLTRTVTKFSLVKGKRKTVKAVLKRFKRLDWGAWIRTHSGRHKRMFKKSPALKRRLRQHVFTNATQSWLLDKMVTNYWRRPKHYIDDPYSPYHKRDEYFATKGKSFKV